MNNYFLNPFELMYIGKIENEIANAKTQDDFCEILCKIENSLPLNAASTDIPFFVIVPPVMDEFSAWQGLIKHIPIPQKHIEKMLKQCFMPFDDEVYKRKTGIGLLEDLRVQERHAIIDLDYGMLIYHDGKSVRNMFLGLDELERYMNKYAYIREYRQRIFSIGADRGKFFCPSYNIDKNTDTITIDINSREELDQIIEEISKNILVNPDLELWYRGQTSEYLLPDFSEEANAKICPWRDIRDVSLVPSLYRNIGDRISNLKEYSLSCLELDKYCFITNGILKIPKYTLRKEEEEAEELLPESWVDSVGGLTTRTIKDTGEVEIHDYHHRYRAIQLSLFLQHYGLDSSILDITHDPDVALFFAQNKVVHGNTYQKVNFSEAKPVIYLFILDKSVDRFLNSSALLEKYGLLRPVRQKCGVLTGASFISRGAYSRYISVRINLKNYIEYQSDLLTPEYLFPDESEDFFLNKLMDIEKKWGFKYQKPFVLKGKSRRD